jgi:salicylate hydroxylase
VILANSRLAAVKADQACAPNTAPDHAENLLSLLQFLAKNGYRFTTTTPLTHQRILNRIDANTAVDLRDVFGWNMQFAEASAPAGLLSQMQRAGILRRTGTKLQSFLRVATIKNDLFLHSSYPTLQEDSVFFGPDTYRFAQFILRSLSAYQASQPSAGLTAALALEKYTDDSIKITLLDRNKNSMDYKGIEYGIRERACQALDRLGLKKLALLNAHKPSEQVFQNAISGAIERRTPLKLDTTFNVLRGEFLNRLTSLLRRTEILRQHDAIKLEPLAGGSVRIHFGPSEDGFTKEPLDFDIVIACDGANSVARSQYFPHAKTIDRGFSSIYALIDANDHRDDAKVSDVVLPKHFRELANGDVNFYSHGHFSTNIIFPQGRNRMALALNFDHPTASKIWRAHGLAPDVKWTEIPVNIKNSISLTVARDTPAFDNVIAKSLAFVRDWNSPYIYHWEMRDSDLLQEPYAPDANIVFVGDSVRAFLPTIGMGASLAIEDAEMLGSYLGNYFSQVVAHQNRIEDMRLKVFRPYFETRGDTWADLLDRARMAARNFIGHDTMKRFEVAPFIPTTFGKVVVHTVEATRRKLNL